MSESFTVSDVEWVRQQMKVSPDVKMIFTSAMSRFESSGIGDFARNHDEEFAVLLEAAKDMVEQIPEEDLLWADGHKLRVVDRLLDEDDDGL